MANQNNLMDVMSLLGNALQTELNAVKAQADESKKKIETEVQAVIDAGRTKLQSMDAQFNEKFTAQDKKVDEKIAKFKADNIQPLDNKITALETGAATTEVSLNRIDGNVKAVSERVNRADETFKAISIATAKKS
jgi:hypothetical protein